MEMKPSNIGVINNRAANIYEAVIVCAAKARIYNDETRMEYNSLLNTMNPEGVDDDFDDKLNADKLKISLEFEKRPKPHLAALHKLLNEGVKYRYKDVEVK